ncbi:hypothetical protein [Streptomyces anulatus]|uniref:hypothetical protein n=1 Tax=Streptomyces anulatus TaxID=1892 RepID=UPI003682BF35
MNALLLAAVLAAATLTGYAAGRYRPGDRLLSWAQDVGDRRAARWPVSLGAAIVIVLAVASVWTFHPRRSAANRRSWREENTRTATPARDPNWARNRTAGTDTADG